MKILVVSDTHGRTYNLDKVLEIEKDIDFFIHCGDVVGDEDYIATKVKVPLIIVAGNNDYFSGLSKEVIHTIMGVKVLVTHGHRYGVYTSPMNLYYKALENNCKAVFYGHTHVPNIEVVNDIVLMNPGSLELPRQIGHKPSYGIVNIDTNGNISGEIKYLPK